MKMRADPTYDTVNIVAGTRNDLTVHGGADFKNTLQVRGPTTLRSSLTVAGNTSMQAVQVIGSMTTKDIHVYGNVKVNESLVLTQITPDSNLTIHGDLVVDSGYKLVVESLDRENGRTLHQVIDYTPTITNIANASVLDRIGQTFTVLLPDEALAGSLYEIKAYIRTSNGNPPPLLRLKTYNGDEYPTGLDGGTIADSAPTTDFIEGSLTPQLASFIFPTQPRIVSGEKYVFEVIYPEGSTGDVQYVRLLSDLYAGGKGFQTLNPGIDGDYYFQVYVLVDNPIFIQPPMTIEKDLHVKGALKLGGALILDSGTVDTSYTMVKIFEGTTLHTGDEVQHTIYTQVNHARTVLELKVFIHDVNSNTFWRYLDGKYLWYREWDNAVQEIVLGTPIDVGSGNPFDYTITRYQNQNDIIVKITHVGIDTLTKYKIIAKVIQNDFQI